MVEKEEKKETEEKVKEREIVVLKELPTVPTRIVIDEEGKEYNAVTMDEAISEILISIREIKKGIVG